jgi:hypothetical protein
MKNGLILSNNRTKYWHKPGTDLLHREGGPAIEHVDGDKSWYKDGKLHREDGPAIENANGDKWWYKEGKCHREDGPAYEGAYGSKVWWYEGKYLFCKTQEEFLRLIKLKVLW